MNGSPASLDDPSRLAALRATSLLDSAPEDTFDRLARLAAQALRAPTALVSLVDQERQFFKSSIGLAEPWASRRGTPLTHSFCQFVVTSGQPFAVEDAHAHTLVCNNLAIEDLGVVAYLGVPLTLPAGWVIGTLCVIDQRPRVWTDSELELLRALANLVMSEIERRHDLPHHLSKLLDAVPAAAVVLAPDGRIVSVSERWRALAHESGMRMDVGSNYLDLCDWAQAYATGATSTLAAGVRDVLAGRAAEFSTECTCYASKPRRWFELRVTPLLFGGNLGAVATHVEVSRTKRAEHARARAEAVLRNVHTELHLLLHEAPVGVCTLRASDGAVLSWNPAAEQLSGFTADEVVGRPLPLQTPEAVEAFQDLLAQVVTGDAVTGETVWSHRRGGAPIPVRAQMAPLRGQDGTVQSILAIIQASRPDVDAATPSSISSEFDAVGHLAGGIAHNFNNLLTGILGYSELLLSSLPRGGPARGDVREIRDAAVRGAKLVSELLAFARRQVLQSEELDLNTLLQETEAPLVERLGDKIVMTMVLDQALGRIRADRSRILQVVESLVMHAREAMPDGGRMVIHTTNVGVDEGDGTSNSGIPPGDYVMLAVSDTGAGMDAQTQLHIFEPFFTTKALHETGRGLGLAAVYGIVGQSGGHLTVSSDPGRGTTFTIYLPRIKSAVTRQRGDR